MAKFVELKANTSVSIADILGKYIQQQDAEKEPEKEERE